MGERLVVQFARGSNRPRDENGFVPRQAPRPRRTVHRMTITGLPFETSWQDLKDFARQSGLDVVYSEVNRERDPNGGGKGYVTQLWQFDLRKTDIGARSYVEYETAADLASAVEKLDNAEFKGSTVRCISDVSLTNPLSCTHKSPVTEFLQPHSEIPRQRDHRPRSRSPGYRGGGRGHGGYPPDDYYGHYDRRGPPRGGYSPRRDDYRRRSPPPRGYYDDHQRDDRYGPPRRGPPPMDDYPPPPRGRYPPEDRYGGPPPGPPQRGYEDPYANGHGHGHGREPYRGPPSPPHRREGRGYDRGGYDSRPY